MPEELPIAGFASWVILGALIGYYIASKSTEMDENTGAAFGAAIGTLGASGILQRIPE